MFDIRAMERNGKGKMEPNNVHSRIGEKIRDLRNRNGLTQQELADRAELTKGYISQLERGQVAPSVVTLLDLIECLGTTPSEFFRETEQEHIVYSEDAFSEKIDESGNSIRWIVPNAQQNQMEPLLVTIRPGEQLQEDKPHEGEEFGYVISGCLTLHLGENVYTVKEGESFYFSANRTHYIGNTGVVPAKFIWVSTPPTF